ncbi:MAG: hypothetical protein SF051_05295 [Elusimicrobiota bacterium]|nr:hypothetical protein [Elusimicrobiota bacterium]
MNNNRKSLFIRSYGSDVETLKKGLVWLGRLAESDPAKRKAAIAVYTKGQLSGTTIETVLGTPACKALAKGQTVGFGKATLSLITARERIYSWNGPILAAYPPKKLLDALDDVTGVTDLMVIPWTMEEIDFWVKAWSAEELGSTAPKPERPSLDPVVVAALKTLTDTVNLSTGITHPSDKMAALDTFRILVGHGVAYHPSAVRAWLVGQGGWSPRDADAVQEIAQGYLDGKRFRGHGQPFWGDNIINSWREEAAKAS